MMSYLFISSILVKLKHDCFGSCLQGFIVRSVRPHGVDAIRTAFWKSVYNYIQDQVEYFPEKCEVSGACRLTLKTLFRATFLITR